MLKTPGAVLLAAAGMTLCAGVAGAQDLRAGNEPPVTHGLDHSVDITRFLPSFGADPSRTRSRIGLSAAASLPDPRALKGANAREATRLRLNLKGFSLLEAREREGTEVRVRRVRQREWRRPVVSLTLQKRF